jgi:hypothetical protein
VSNPVLILVLIVLLLVIASLLGAARFAGRAQRLRRRLLAGAPPRDVAAALPPKVRDFALRADARPDDLAHSLGFSQRAEMQARPGGPWQLLDATQTVATGAPGFVWQAEQALGPLSRLQVIDAFANGSGCLSVQVLGLIPAVRARGADIDRGEAMRYLAELPWCPDAILGNPSLVWRMLDEDWAEVSLAGASVVAVRFRFDAAGDIAEMRARDRPATDPAGKPVRYDWQGYFRDYRRVGPRRVPVEAEVGYVYTDGYRAYFQCRIIGYSAAH